MALNPAIIDQVYAILNGPTGATGEAGVNQFLGLLLRARDDVLAFVGSPIDPGTGQQATPGIHAAPEFEIGAAAGATYLVGKREEMAVIAEALVALLRGP